MIKLLMAKNYKLEISIPLEKIVKLNEDLCVPTTSNKGDTKKGPKNA